MNRFVVVALVLFSMSLSGCGLLSSPARAVPARYVESASITPAAAALVGEARAKQAADEATTFALETSFNPALLDPNRVSYTAAELNSPTIQDALTPGTLILWNQLIQQAATGNPDAEEEVKALEMFALRQSTWRVNPDGKIVYSEAISNLVVDVAAQPSPAAASGASPAVVDGSAQTLKVSFKHMARLRYSEDKHPFEVTFTRSVEYQMVPSNSTQGQLTPSKITTVTATPRIPPRPGSTAIAGGTTVAPVGTALFPTAAASGVSPQPVVTLPIVTAPVTTAPVTTQPETTQPETTQPETTQPETTSDPVETTSDPASEDVPAGPLAFVWPMAAPLSSSASATATSTTSRMWQIAMFFGSFEVTTVDLPR